MEASSEFHAPASLTPERDHGTRQFSGRSNGLGEEKISLVSTGIWAPNRAAHSLVAIPTALFALLASELRKCFIVFK